MDAVLRRVGIYFLCTLLAAPMGMAVFGALLIHPNATDGQSFPTRWAVLASALWLVVLGRLIWKPLSSDGTAARP